MTDHSVFVIDDDQAMRDSLLMLLRGEGIRARGFVLGTGQEGGFVGGRTEDGETEVFFEEELQNLVPEVMEPFVPEGALEMPD